MTAASETHAAIDCGNGMYRLVRRNVLSASDNPITADEALFVKLHDDLLAAAQRISELEAKSPAPAQERELLLDALDFVDGAQSGYIPGCAGDLRFAKRRDEWLIETRALLSTPAADEARRGTQEPVAWMIFWDGQPNSMTTFSTKLKAEQYASQCASAVMEVRPLYAAPQPTYEDGVRDGMKRGVEIAKQAKGYSYAKLHIKACDLVAARILALIPKEKPL